MVATSTPELNKLKEASDLKKKKLLAKEERKEAMDSKLKKKTTAKKQLFEDVHDDSASDMSVSECLPECTDSESECESDVLQLDVVETVKVGEYVVVMYSQKASVSYWVGRVLKERDEEDDVEIEFLRRKGGRFVKPVVEDIASVHIDNIKCRLPDPKVCGTTERTKGEFVFPTTNFGKLNIH